LRIARSVPPIKRDKADKILKEFMQRVEEINTSDYYLYRVSKILLFGSYIKEDAVNFGDIDIAFELERKIENPDEFQKLNRDFYENAEDDGKRFSSFIEKLFYSETVVILKLKNRNRYISLHKDDDILKVTKTKQIYPVSLK
jgi:predicted nucleotidyltransferase